jgi:pimeloyl-ACP methyl ester carboxylesterase
VGTPRHPPASAASARHWLLRAGVALGVAYAALLALLWWQQERLIFRSEALPAATSFAKLGPDVHERWIDTPGGGRLHALHLKLPAPDGLVFFLKGNAGHLGSWFTNPDFYRRLNMDLVMFDYRGYGKSPGRITSQAELHADVRAVWDAVAPAYAGRRIVIVGRSLGSGLAAPLAAEVKPAKTVLVSAYASMGRMAREQYPLILPMLVPLVLRYPLDTEAVIASVPGEVLLIHGAADTFIPPTHSEALAARRPGTRLVVVEGAGHGDIQRSQGYLKALAEAIRPPP